VIGYVGEGDKIKHYLIERADLEKKTIPGTDKCFPFLLIFASFWISLLTEFLLECKEFTSILQVLFSIRTPLSFVLDTLFVVPNCIHGLNFQYCSF
jgi:hypothetical protein